MTNVWFVRAGSGAYTKHFLEGSYAAVGVIYKADLSGVRSADELYPLYKKEHPEDTSNIVVGSAVGQIARFLEIREGDYVITPAADTEWLHYGNVEKGSSYFFSEAKDGCPYPHRRSVAWAKQALKRGDFSVPFQNTIRSMHSVFSVSQHHEEFLAAIGQAEPAQRAAEAKYDPYRVVLEQVLSLDAKEFEILVGHLLTALGFEGSEVTGKAGDGGVDATGELNAYNLAKVKIFVQAKRYKLGVKISASTVKQLRQAIPFGGQGAFITTADYQAAATDVALEQGFPRIGLINGRQLVDLLVEHWNDIPQEFRERLGLKPGLVRA